MALSQVDHLVRAHHGVVHAREERTKSWSPAVRRS
jgi:hypothetical protein